MVKLSLVSTKGNHAVRYQGYLGLTPLRFEGCVRTQIEQDGKPILAKDITVAIRCYESRQGRLGSTQTNVLYEHSITLWQKLDTQVWSEVGDLELPFRFSIPSHITAPSTALYFQEYKIFWRLEAVLNHIPISAVGSRQMKHCELALVRYDAPVSVSTSSTSSSPCMSLSWSKSRTLPLRYHILVPPNPIGPLDLVSVQLIVQPLDSSVFIRSASASVERRIHFTDSRSSPLESPPGPCRFPSYSTLNHPNTSSHAQDDGSLTYSGSNSPSSQDSLHPAPSSSVDSSQPLLQHHEPSTDASASSPCGGRGTTHILAHAESRGRFSRDSSGVWRHNLTFSWPSTKSNSRWAVGESVQTALASVKFFLRVKLIVSSLANSAETVELEDKELIIVSTNDLQRQLALSQYSERVNTTLGRSKSKSPRCSKRDHHTKQPLLSPPHSPHLTLVSEEPYTESSCMNLSLSPTHSHKMSTASSPYPGGNSSTAKISRRPHTSAGPRDWSSIRDEEENLRNYNDRLAVPLRPETAHPTRSSKAPSCSRALFHQPPVEASRWRSNPTVNSGQPLTVRSSQHHAYESFVLEKANLGDVQAWEQELARIESASRRSSADMLGFLSQRKKASVEQSSILTYLHAEG